MILGSHVSYKNQKQLLGSVEEALKYNANTFMFYTGAPQNSLRKEINPILTEEGLSLLKKTMDINNIIVHAPYIINPANGNEFNKEFLQKEINRLEQLQMTKLVLHPGSHTKLTKEEGMENIIKTLNEIDSKNITICLETMAGKGTEIGSKLEEIKYILDNTKNTAVCLDTCHINDSGYDINTILDDFDKIIGLKYLKCIHINDSKNLKSSKKDRHENIGFGTIGFENLINFIYDERIKDIPKILETPYIDKYPPYKFEIEMIKNKKLNKNLVNEVENYYNGS